jgi:5-methylcytosine-specific restriction enzyme A
MAWSTESRQARGYGAHWDKLRAQAMARDMWLCQPCRRLGCVTVATECDHVTPKAKGGDDELPNLQAICRPCHRAKTDREAAEAQGRKVRPRIGLDGWPV